MLREPTILEYKSGIRHNLTKAGERTKRAIKVKCREFAAAGRFNSGAMVVAILDIASEDMKAAISCAFRQFKYALQASSLDKNDLRSTTEQELREHVSNLKSMAIPSGLAGTSTGQLISDMTCPTSSDHA